MRGMVGEGKRDHLWVMVVVVVVVEGEMMTATVTATVLPALHCIVLQLIATTPAPALPDQTEYGPI